MVEKSLQLFLGKELPVPMIVDKVVLQQRHF